MAKCKAAKIRKVGWSKKLWLLYVSNSDDDYDLNSTFNQLKKLSQKSIIKCFNQQNDLNAHYNIE